MNDSRPLPLYLCSNGLAVASLTGSVPRGSPVAGATLFTAESGKMVRWASKVGWLVQVISDLASIAGAASALVERSAAVRTAIDNMVCRKMGKGGRIGH